MVEKCFADFKRVHTNTNDAERSDHPKSAFVPENIKKADKMVLADCKLKLREIPDTLNISEGSLFTTRIKVNLNGYFQNCNSFAQQRAAGESSSVNCLSVSGLGGRSNCYGARPERELQ